MRDLTPSKYSNGCHMLERFFVLSLPHDPTPPSLNRCLLATASKVLHQLNIYQVFGNAFRWCVATPPLPPSVSTSLQPAGHALPRGARGLSGLLDLLVGRRGFLRRHLSIFLRLFRPIQSTEGNPMGSLDLAPILGHMAKTPYLPYN